MKYISLDANRTIVVQQGNWTSINRYFLISCILLFSSAASMIAKSDVALVVCTFYAIFLNSFGVRAKEYLLQLLKLITVFMVVILVYLLKSLNLDFYSWYGLACKIIIGFSCIFYCENEFEKYFLKLIYVLASISLVLYSLQLINFNLIFSLNNLFSIGENKGLDPNSNSLVFNLVNKHSFRNCGFMWEPGAYASVLVIALAISFKCDSKFDTLKVVLILSILTTISSMGYISLFIIIGYFLYKRLKYYSVILIVPLVLMFSNINILSEKIGGQIDDIDSELYSTQFSEDYIIHLNRFTSFYADYNTFIENPFLGLGIDIYTAGQKVYYKEYDKNIIRTSGLMSLLVKVGLVGFSIFIYLVYCGVKSRYRDSKFAILFILLLMVILFSNPIEVSPIVLMFLTL